MGADYYESEEDRAALEAEGRPPIGVGENSVLVGHWGREGIICRRRLSALACVCPRQEYKGTQWFGRRAHLRAAAFCGRHRWWGRAVGAGAATTGSSCMAAQLRCHRLLPLACRRT